MVEAHLFDAWVRAGDRSDLPYRWAIAIGGYSAPLFLFLAGVAMALAAGARLRRGLTTSQTASVGRRRGWQILGLAFLFRLQSFLISGGPFPETLLKVDILNVMGLSMLVGAMLWAVSSRNLWRSVALLLAALGFVLVTPLVRTASFVATLPYPIEWYFRSASGSGAFTLFPWVAFLLSGVVLGLWLDQAQTERDERRFIRTMALVGPLIAGIGYLATYLPPVYTDTTYWTGSPTLFFVRLGVLIMAVAFAYGWNVVFRGWSPVRDVGVASLFVYWVHVEMVYGVVSIWLHRSLTFGQAVLAYLALSLLLFGLVKLKDRAMRAMAPLSSKTLVPSHTS